MQNGSNGAKTIETDVAILGGGPTGSTCATFLRKYNPDLRVTIVEKEVFPREHVGESQLPSIGPILDEMGVWDKVEAEGFPIKIGASYTWGAKLDRWDFDFYPVELWKDEPRPAKFEGQRRHTAFQVDRDRYDEILLHHARDMGADLLQPVRVIDIPVVDDHVQGFVLDDGRTLKAKHYVDGSGTVGLVRRALGVEVDAPEQLRNIAVWDYWENAEWAVEIGVGGTRVQVRSLPYGWMWFIPLGPTRTSIGLICPASKYKEMGLSVDELYLKAIADQPEITALTKNGTRTMETRSCKDWSQLADRLVGPNWFICGEAAGFADPILAAGMSLAHSSGREAAYSILELERGELDAAWIRDRFNTRNRTNIRQHIQFAQYWYAANTCFTDLKDHCTAIAKQAGLRLSPDQAWRWLSQGGFTTESVGIPTFGSFDVACTKQILERFDAKDRKTPYLADGYNVFELNLHNAKDSTIGVLGQGRINMVPCYERGNARLPLVGYYKVVVDTLKLTSDAREMTEIFQRTVGSSSMTALTLCMQALDTMIQESWVLRKKDSKRPVMHVGNEGNRFVRSSEDTAEALAKSKTKPTYKSNL